MPVSIFAKPFVTRRCEFRGQYIFVQLGLKQKDYVGDGCTRFCSSAALPRMELTLATRVRRLFSVLGMGQPVAWMLLDETLSADTPLSGGERVWLTPLFRVCAGELRADILEGMDDIVLE